MFIAINKIEIPAAQHQRMEQAFERSVPQLKQFAGFLGFELWHGEDDTLVSLSRWESKEAFEAYIHSDTFRQHHGGSSHEQSRPAAQISYYTGRVIE